MFSVGALRPLVKLQLSSMLASEGILVFASLLGVLVILQVTAGAYASGFGGYPDEPAHFVTALMVRDFIAHPDLHPLQFAQQFYYHYPKVAIGHWPPLFYAVLGVWFLIFGASRVTAILFIAIVAAATASAIYFTGKRLVGRWAGIFAALLFVASPVVQESSDRLMSEHLSTLCMLVSTLLFARFAKTGRLSTGLAFGFLAALAILTHPNAWALGLVPPLTIALTSRWWLLRRLGLWLAAMLVLVLTVPWYVATLRMLQDGVGEGAPFWVQGPEFAWFVYAALGAAVLLFAAIGVWVTLINIPRARVAPEWAALAALAVSTFVLHSVIPTGADSRYMVPVIASSVLFAAIGLDTIANKLVWRLPMGATSVALGLAVFALFAVERFALPVELRNGGYDTLVNDVTERVEHVPQNWLISSGSTGEGSLIAALALKEPQPESYVLRGKTILAGGGWMWNNTEDRFDTPQKLATLLDDIPVSLVVIDDRIPSLEVRPYQQRLKNLLASEPNTWKLIGSYSQVRGGLRSADSLHVYARQPVDKLSSTRRPIDLERLKALMVRDELR